MRKSGEKQRLKKGKTQNWTELINKGECNKCVYEKKWEEERWKKKKQVIAGEGKEIKMIYKGVRNKNDLQAKGEMEKRRK